MRRSLVSLLRLGHVRERNVRRKRPRGNEPDPMAQLLKELWECVVKPVWDAIEGLVSIRCEDSNSKI